ncbi:MAG TPA: hypothetical protein VF642_03785 [Propionibacteriaceae bacterium]
MARRWSTPSRLRRFLTVGVALAVGFLLVPFALNERPGTEAARDRSSLARGEVAELTTELQRLGFTCSDQDPRAAVLSRLCTTSEAEQSGRLLLDAQTSSGQVSRVAVDAWDAQGPQELGADLATALAQALDLTQADSDRLAEGLAREPGGPERTERLRWGTFTASSVEGALRVDLRRVGWQPPDSVPGAGVRQSVGRLQQVAETLGYACETPDITSIRACNRTSGGYSYELWAQGKGDTIRMLDLTVTSTHRRHTRERSASELIALLTGLGTPQTSELATWVDQTRGAQGGDAFVGGVHVSFDVNGSAYTKETRAAIRTSPCGLQPARTLDPCRVEE